MAAACARPPKFQRTGESYRPREDLRKYAEKKLSAQEKMIKQTRLAVAGTHISKKPQASPSSEDSWWDDAEPAVPLLKRKVTCLTTNPQSATDKGSRPYQEDRILEPVEIKLRAKGKELKATLFGLFDGHGEEGRCATMVRDRLAELLTQRLNEGLNHRSQKSEEEVIGDAFTEVFADLAKEYTDQKYRLYKEIDGKRHKSLGGGTTVCCGLRFGNRIYFPNVGDSRAILVKQDQVLQLTEDAVLTNPRFRKFHDFVGNTIELINQVWRVFRGKGSLQIGMARAVGSNEWMCARPKISFLTLGAGKDDLAQGKIFAQDRDFLLFMSDGVTGRFSNQEIYEQFVRNRERGMSPEQNIQEITRNAGMSAGSDNSTILLVPIKGEWLAPSK